MFLLIPTLPSSFEFCHPLSRSSGNAWPYTVQCSILAFPLFTLAIKPKRHAPEGKHPRHNLPDNKKYVTQFNGSKICHIGVVSGVIYTPNPASKDKHENNEQPLA